MKYLLPLLLLAALNLNTGCATIETLLGIKVPTAAKVKKTGGLAIDNIVGKGKAEKNIDLYLGIAAGLAGLAIVIGGIICVVQLLAGGNWRLGAGLWGGGIVGIIGLYAVAVILPWLKLIVIILLAIIVVAALCWLGYQIFVLKRSFKQIIAGFQLAKAKDWTKETKAEIAASYAPATEKLVAAVKTEIKAATAAGKAA